MVSRFRRYWQMADILFKYQFGVIVQKLFPGVHRYRGFQNAPIEEVTSEYARMRMAIEELGPTYIKFGQIMSTRQEVLPPGLIEELKKLQDRTNPLPYEVIKNVIQKNLPRIEDCFIKIDEVPLASASLSQVHRGTLMDGTEIVLKVQRPGIAGIIETDIQILRSLATRAENAFPEWRVYNPRGLVNDFAVQIRKELDFLQDGKNADRLRKNMRGVEGVGVPKIYWEYCSRQLLVMEYIPGVRVDDVSQIREFGINPKKIAINGFNAYMKQIFEDGFFHGDPHPGNLMVTGDGTLYFLDFGIVGVIRPERRLWFIALLEAIINQDPSLVLKSMEGLGVVIPESAREELRDEIYIAMLDAEGSLIGQYDFTGMANNLTRILRNYHIQVPINLMLMLKVIIMVLDVGVTLNPKFNFLENSTKFMSRLSANTSILEQVFKRGTDAVVEAADGLFDTPRNLNRMLKSLSTGTIKIDIVDTDIRRLQQALDRTSDKVLIGLILAGMVVGSSFVLRESVIEIPSIVITVAILSYVAATIIGFYSLYHIIFSRFGKNE
jgi:ubiquinone biosynthesis protein